MDASLRRPLAAMTAIYLAIPLFFFSFGWLRAPYSWITAMLVLGLVAYAIRDLAIAWRAPVQENPGEILDQVTRALIPALLIVTAWLFFSGVSGFGQQTGDYKSSNAMFKGLIDSPWPLQIEFRGKIVSIVYYTAYYLPAAGVGKLFGWRVANGFLFGWTLIGVLLAFLWFWQVTGIRPGWKSMTVVALVFCLAGGLDAVGYYLLHSHPFVWGKHIENWNPYFQYSSQTALLYWVPQQAVAAWLVTGMTYACLEDARLFRYLGMSIAACILWSPFGVVGIAPYLLGVGIALLWQKQARVLFEPASLALNVASLWVGGILLLYISSNEYKFPAGLLWNLAKNRSLYVGEALAFWILEFGLLAAAAVALGLFVRDTIPGRLWAFVAVAGVIVTVLPLFKMGYNNDLVMRGSIPSLFYFWAFVVRALVTSVPQLVRRRVAIVHALAVCLLAIGVYTSLSEIIRSAGSYHMGAPEESKVLPIATATYPHIVEQRVGRDDTLFYRYLGR